MSNTNAFLDSMSNSMSNRDCDGNYTRWRGLGGLAWGNQADVFFSEHYQASNGPAATHPQGETENGAGHCIG